MGKFDSKNKNSSVDVYQLIAERNAAAANRGQQPRQPRQPQQAQQSYQPQQAQQRAYPQPVAEEPRRRGPVWAV